MLNVIPTGLIKIDNIINGLSQQNIGIILSTCGHGKTTTLVNIARYALLLKKNVLYITFENDKRDIIKKIATSTKSSGKKTLPKECGIKVTGLSYTGNSQLSFKDVESQIKRTKPDIVFIDDIQILLSQKSIIEKQQFGNNMINKLLHQLKKVAIDLNIPIWATINCLHNKINIKSTISYFNVADIIISLKKDLNDPKKVKIFLQKKDYKDEIPIIDGYLDGEKSIILT